MHVTLHDVSKTFSTPRGPQKPFAPSAAPTLLSALGTTNLDIRSGEFVGFLGPSGCGKSTLLRLIAAQIAPTTGTIRLDGEPPDEARVRKQIAWMAQNPGLLPWKTVRANVALPRTVNRNHQRPAPDPQALLDMVQLATFADAHPSTLSGGMQQRVALARTLATGASLWLMDEPFAALDELTRERLADEVLHLWRLFRPTVLWVTHNITEAARMADRVFVLTSSPGVVRGIVSIDLPRPRDETSAEMVSVIRDLRSLLRQ